MSSHYYCSCDKRWHDDESCPACHPNDFVLVDQYDDVVKNYNFEHDLRVRLQIQVRAGISDALISISKNSCCGSCQEAKLALKALETLIK